MGFPEAIARAQREAMRGDLQRMVDLLDGMVFGLREVNPHNVALSRGEYDRVKEYLVGAKISLANALTQIDGAMETERRKGGESE